LGGVRVGGRGSHNRFYGKRKEEKIKGKEGKKSRGSLLEGFVWSAPRNRNGESRLLKEGAIGGK